MATVPHRENLNDIGRCVFQLTDHVIGMKEAPYMNTLYRLSRGLNMALNKPVMLGYAAESGSGVAARPGHMSRRSAEYLLTLAYVVSRKCR